MTNVRVSMMLGLLYCGLGYAGNLLVRQYNNNIIVFANIIYTEQKCLQENYVYFMNRLPLFTSMNILSTQTLHVSYLLIVRVRTYTCYNNVEHCEI